MPNFASIARQTVTPWQTGLRPSWTIGQIRAALLAHAAGEMASASQLFDAMLQDDEFPGDLQKRINALLRSEFCLKPQDGPADKKLNRREQAAEDTFPDMVPDGELFDLIASWLVLGVGVATIDWDIKGPLWIPRLRALPTEFLRYDEYARKWFYQAREGEQEVVPGNGTWVLLTSGQRGWIWGLIRGLATLWLSKQLTYGDWQRYCQKHGLPIIKAKVPIFRDDKEKDKFIEDLSMIQSEGVVGLPTGPDGDGYDIELLEATDQSWEAFEANIARADRKIQVMLLGSNIGTEQTAETGGSRAAAETSSSGLDQDKAKSDAKYVGQCLFEQFLTPFFSVNFGAAQDVPYPFWDVCPEEDAREWVDAQSTFVTMLASIRTSGYKITNIEQIAKDYGFELEVDLDAPPPPGSEAAAEIAAKSKPPVAAPYADDAPETEDGFEILDELPPGDWLELTDDQALVLLARARKAGGKAKAAGPRTIQTGPRGGRFYINPSGRKVYIKKGAPDPKPKAAKKVAAKPKKAASGGGSKATKAAAAKAKDDAETAAGIAKAKAAGAAAAARAPGEAKARAAAVKSLGASAAAIHIGPGIKDHEVINAARELKAAGFDKIFGGENPKLGALVLGATPHTIKTGWVAGDQGSPVAGRPGSYVSGPISGIQETAGGLYSNKQQWGESFLKVSTMQRDATPEQAARIAENSKAIDAYRASRGLPNSAALGGDHFTVSVPGRSLSTTLIHEFGHAVHLEPIGPYKQIDSVVQKAYASAVKTKISKYADSDHREYFAEAHAAYRFKNAELKASDPGAHKMVSDVLKLRGIE